MPTQNKLLLATLKPKTDPSTLGTGFELLNPLKQLGWRRAIIDTEASIRSVVGPPNSKSMSGSS